MQKAKNNLKEILDEKDYELIKRDFPDVDEYTQEELDEGVKHALKHAREAQYTADGHLIDPIPPEEGGYEDAIDESELPMPALSPAGKEAQRKIFAAIKRDFPEFELSE